MAQRVEMEAVLESRVRSLPTRGLDSVTPSVELSRLQSPHEVLVESSGSRFGARAPGRMAGVFV